jgi:hypothetical protein
MLFGFSSSSSSSSGQCYRFPSPLYHGLIHLTAHASFALPQSHPLNEVLFLHIEKDFNEVSKTFKKDDWSFKNAFVGNGNICRHVADLIRGTYCVL